MLGTYYPVQPARMKGEKTVEPFIEETFVQYLPNDAALTLDSVTIGILTALPHECAAVCSVFDCVGKRTGASTRATYHLGKVHGKQGEGLIVAVALLTNMGTNPAAAKVANMLNDCKNIKDVIVCGIAGAIPAPQSPDDHVRVGDIVVSTDGVVQYDFGKQHGPDFLPTGRPYLPSTRLTAAARQLRVGETMERRPWERLIELALQTLSADFQRPDDATDVLCEADWTNPRRIIGNVIRAAQTRLGLKPSYPAIPHPADTGRRPGHPRVFDGLVGSANSVLKSRRMRERLRKKYPLIRAVEMEGVGAAEACREREVGYFMVRGTCDYCNEHKNNVWQYYAALAAAAYTKALLEETDVSVFRTQTKVLTIVRTVDAEMSVADQFMDEAISGGAETLVPRGSEVPAGDLVGSVSPNSETVKEIPWLPVQVAKDSTALGRSTMQAQDVFLPRVADSPVPERTVEQLPTAPHIDERQPHGALVSVADTERRFLTADAERRCAELEDLLDRWEFGALFAAAADTVQWISMYEANLPAEILARVYMVLARIELSRSRPEGGHDENAMNLARRYIDKAKDAAN